MKTKLSKTLKHLLSTQLTKCLLVVLCTALIASALPLEAIAQAAEEALSSMSASSTASTATSATTDEDTADTTDEDAEEAVIEEAVTEATDTEDTDTDSEDSTDETSPIVAHATSLLAGIEALSLVEEANQNDIAAITAFSISNIADGTENFDESTDPTSDYYYLADGNDQNASNGRVRTFDTVTYTLSYTAQVHDGVASFGSDYLYIYFEFILPMSEKEAAWYTDSMLWMSDYEIVTKQVTYDFDGDGSAETKECQVITGYRQVAVGSSNQTVQSSLAVSIQVLASSNGAEITPVFTVWVAGNEANGTSLADLADPDDASTTATKNTDACSTHNSLEQQTLAANNDFDETADYAEGEVAYDYAVEVTCAPRYNISLVQGAEEYTAIGTYDFSIGNQYALDKDAGTVTGKVTSYGITIQLYNHDGCGLKGIEIPTGDITFDIELSTVFVDDQGTEYSARDIAGFQPLVLSWGPQNATIYDERELTDITITYAVGGAPGNSGMTAFTSSGSSDCYDGGTWKASKSSNTISVTVSDYDIKYPLFPNAAAGIGNTASTYFNLSDAVEDLGTIEIGSFSAGKLFILTPYYDTTETSESDATYITNKLNVSDGYFETTLTVKEVQIDVDSSRKVGETTDASVADDVSGDNSVTSTIQLMDAYKASQSWRAQWTYSGGTSVYYDVVGRGNWVSGNWANNGQDALALGSTVGLLGSVDNNENSYAAKNRMYAADLLVKFDGNAVTLTEKYETTGIDGYGYEVTILYATKKDGSNWSNDAEMNETAIEDLVYYSTLVEAQAKGVVVAYLAEIRPVSNNPSNIKKNSAGSNIRVSVRATVNTNTNLVGEVYQTVVAGKIWRASEWNNAAENVNEGEAVIPSMAGHGQSDGVGGTTTVTLPTASVDYFPTDYTKTVYSAKGSATDSEAYTKGDSLLILEATPSITKTAEQEVYDIDNGQTTVKYTLTPSFDSTAYNEPYETTLTTLTITDTLPAGTSYVEGSAEMGGTAISDPASTDNQDGTTTLTWTITGVSTTDDMSKYTITYSAEIDSSAVSNGDVLSSSATITYNGTFDSRSDDDLRAYYESLGNMSTASFTVSKRITTTISKKADELVYDPGDAITYTLTLSSTTKEDFSGAVILDIIPYNGDSLNSSFVGSLTLSSVTLSGDTDLEGWTVYYTEDDPSGIDTDDLEDIITNSGVTWKQASVNTSTGVVSNIPDTATAIVWIGNSSVGSSRFEAELVLQTSNDISGGVNEGAKIVNGLYYNGSVTRSSTSTEAYIANRSITGRVWLDTNADGLQDATEETLEGVTVTLCDASGNPITDTSGSPVSLVTQIASSDQITTYTIDTNGRTVVATAKADGSYEFSRLPGGTYTIRFSSSASVDFEQLEVSQKNAGNDTTADSDALGYYSDSTNTRSSSNTLQYSYIEGIELPTELTEAIYTSSYNDCGLYYCGGLTVSKTAVSEDATGDEEFEFTVSLSDNSINATFAGITFTGGVSATFTLKDGESITFPNLPADVTYEVQETDAQNYTYTTVSVDGGEVEDVSSSGRKAEGSITSGATSTVAFTNTQGLGSLTVTKYVEGAGADPEQYFTLTVELDTELTGTYGEVYFEDGTATFSLKSGEAVAASTLPAEVGYSVSVSGTDGYTVSATLNSIEIDPSAVAATIYHEENHEVVFTSYKDVDITTIDDALPTTGDTTNQRLPLYAAITSAVAVLAIASGIILGKRNNSYRPNSYHGAHMRRA